MGTVNTNKSAAKRCVIFCKHQDEMPLDVLEEFIGWTKKKHLKSYIEIGKLIGVTPNEANRLLCMAKLPDDVVIKRMKGLMEQ